MRAISILILVLFVGNAFAYTFPSSFLKISMKKDLKDRFYTTLHSTQVDDINTAVNENKSSSIKWNYANVLLFTPLLSPLLSVLFAEIANPMISGSERQLLVIGLLLSKRLYLYFSAFGIVDLSSQVASADFVPNIGEV